MTAAEYNGRLPVGTRVALVQGRHDEGVEGIIVGMSAQYDIEFIEVQWQGPTTQNSGGYLPSSLEVLDSLGFCAQCDALKLSANDYLCLECRNDPST